VYPQIFDFMKKRSEKAQAAHIEWGKQKAQNWLQMMNDALIGTGKSLPMWCRDITSPTILRIARRFGRAHGQ